MRILEDVKREIGVPVLTDVHEPDQIAPVCDVVDVVQIPAFLCRQTDFVVGVARAAKVVNVKKGQFLAPWDIKNVVDKIVAAGNTNVLLTERGVSFGYNNLVSDMRSLVIMGETGFPVVFRCHPQPAASRRPRPGLGRRPAVHRAVGAGGSGRGGGRPVHGSPRGSGPGLERRSHILSP